MQECIVQRVRWGGQGDRWDGPLSRTCCDFIYCHSKGNVSWVWVLGPLQKGTLCLCSRPFTCRGTVRLVLEKICHPLDPCLDPTRDFRMCNNLKSTQHEGAWHIVGIYSWCRMLEKCPGLKFKQNLCETSFGQLAPHCTQANPCLALSGPRQGRTWKQRIIYLNV